MFCRVFNDKPFADYWKNLDNLFITVLLLIMMYRQNSGLLWAGAGVRSQTAMKSE
jgi:hypothetical protein